MISLARSINGQFLGTLGASALMVGSVAGFGEFVGYALRCVSGFFEDKSHKYWMVTFVGYVVNMLAMHALELVGTWPMAEALIIAEQTGHAIRRPAVETMLSYTNRHIGNRWVFGLNEAMDHGGATVGPLLVALVLYLKDDYRNGYAVLLISALLCLGTLLVARLLYPHPQHLEKRPPRCCKLEDFPKPIGSM